ncbi:hypothetical protein C1646_764721 [Rhizophagus diaphanus]|nr:hypothetical protein C1646_764721 [Rhizophagus diaphanus] [Rhizophagus sp. MUCL 43196]
MKNYLVDYYDKDEEKENQLVDAFTKVIDQEPIFQDQEIVDEVLKYIEKASYRRIADVLLYVIPNLIHQNILNPNNPVIYIQISDDRCNVGVENYEILHQVIEPMISKLHNLMINKLTDFSGVNWKIEPYFSSNWKFLAIILGFNASNANTAPLLPMIPLDHYMPDELYIMLRVWDRMWALVIYQKINLMIIVEQLSHYCKVEVDVKNNGEIAESSESSR